MKLHILLSSCAALLALTILPSRLLADQFCSDPPPFQYQACGTVAAGNIFTVNQYGATNGVFGFFQGFHADFGSSVYALLFRDGVQIARSIRTATNQDLTVDQRLSFFSPIGLIPPQVGDTVEFVLDDETDPNGEQLYYSQRYEMLNPDHLNHTWAENLTQADCAPGQTGSCVFIGFEDISLQEASDFDYNDFKMWAYGLDLVQEQDLTTLHSFNNADGSFPNELALASDGNFYGTTEAGGTTGDGSSFKITPSGTFTTLYSDFSDNSGAAPNGLVQANDGNFYGTTRVGGPNNCGQFNCGTVFQLTPMGVYKDIHNFAGTDGYSADSALIQANDDYLYGTAGGGGLHNAGVIFKVSLDGSLYKVVYNFGSNSTDGSLPVAPLVQGSDGNLYGTTQNGGGSGNCYTGCGTLFKVTTSGSLTTLHIFNGDDGSYPDGALVQGNDSNFYGTTTGIGTEGYGTVFKITPSGTFTTLHNFCSAQNCADGYNPFAGLVLATDGNFYGTTYHNGGNADGTIFRITPDGVLTTLHSFSGADGANPSAELTQGSDGNFYGTTALGGANNYGTVFRLDVFPALSVLKVGSGTVSSVDGHIYCGGTCSYSYVDGTQVTLSAAPAPGYTFTGWTGCDNMNGSFCSVTMTTAKDVMASFNSVGNVGLTSLSFMPTYVRGGQLSAGTLTLSGAAPPGGLSVALSSDHPGVAHPPSFVIVPPNKTSVQFAVNTFPVKSNITVTITATAGASQVSGTLTVGTTFTPPAIK